MTEKTFAHVERSHSGNLPVSRSANKQVIYIYADAFTTCDCGRDLMLSQRVFGDDTYRGRCACGKNWALRTSKIWECW